MIDFPASPNIGDTFTSGGLSWQWDGAKWAATGGAGTYLPLAGGAMSGAMAVPPPAAPMQPATKHMSSGCFLQNIHLARTASSMAIFV